MKTRMLSALLLGALMLAPAAALASDIESSSWSESAASNTAAVPNGFPDNIAPSQVKSIFREIMGALKRDWDRSHGTIASTGAANAYVLSYGTAPAAYANGQRFSFVANFANSGSATANVKALGALTIQKQTSAGLSNLASGDIQSGQHVQLEFDQAANVRVLLNPQAAAGLPTIANNQVLANTSGVGAPPTGTGVSALIDSALGSTRGAILERGSGGWALLAPSATAGQALASNGTGADPSYQAFAKAPTVASKSGAYTAVAGDCGTVLSASAGSFSITLPGGAAAGNGCIIYFEDLGSGTLTLSRAGSDTLASGPSSTLTSLALNQGDRGYLIDDGGSPAIWRWWGTRHYDSGQQTITSGGSLTLAHGLGVQPTQIFIYLHCTTAEASFSIGDEFLTSPPAGSSGVGSQGALVVPDATNLNVRFNSAANAFVTNNKSTGATVTLTYGDWKALFRAYANN